ncbi:AfsR/SARP family transcriptional regulator [Nonomuraea typhae]|uniref:AfsR/SARP family transcriptional regulator n=1 Tax=Nonomuraea typhae TaxID=2603600 RepID=UPI0012F8D731|nr:BTAD domain-containing putative transcriptional regulator [Nonomuraea typhae]
MRFELLGPVRCLRGEEELDLGSPQQRLTLAALLLAEGRVVGLERLIDILWADAPPKSAANVVRQYLSRLRLVVGAEMIQSVTGGYRCAAATDEADFRRLLSEAAQAPAAEARTLLERALEQWRGEPLAGLPGAWAQAQRVRLAEARLVALESRFEADLALGRHAGVVGELAALHSDHPTRERLSGQLMLALKRAGRQAEAIGVYTDTRLLLAEEYGVDPSAELAAVYQQVIAVQSQPRPAPQGLGVGGLQPAQLPAGTPDFTGRRDVVRDLVEQLTAGTRAMPVVGLSGPGGIGKSTLAVHVAHAVRGNFPDGQLYANLRSGDRAPQEVLAGFLRALGCTDRQIPAFPPERAALLRSMLDGRRVLVVLDDVADPAQVEPLLPGSATCAVIVTSRVRLAGMVGARLRVLDLLSDAEGLELLGRVAGQARVLAEPEAAADLVQACGRLPLAVRIVAARLAARPGMRLEALAVRLADARHRINELKAGQETVAACFALGYEQLPAEQARAFRLLALAEGPDLPVEAAAAMLGVSRTDAEDMCEALVDASLLETTAPGRYRYHDLLRLYGRGLAGEEERATASQRLFEHYMCGIRGVCRVALPGFVHPAGAERPELSFSGAPAARAWMRTEQANVAATIAGSGREGLLGEVPLLAQVTGFADVEDAIFLPAVLLAMGLGAQRMAATDEAVNLLSEALAPVDARTHPKLSAMIHAMLAMALADDGSIPDARRHVEQGLELGRLAGDPHSIGVNQMAQGVVHMRAGELGQAAEQLLASAETYRQGGMPLRAAWPANRLMLVHLAAGRPQEAVAVGEEAVPMAEAMHDPLLAGLLLTRLGQAWETLGDSPQARRCRSEAAAVLRPYQLQQPPPGTSGGAGRARRFLGLDRAEDPAPA